MASAESQVLSWYAGLEPLTVDVIGEFAGRELFVVHGEALIRHCLEQSRVDYDGGFQLLHAVYAVEKFLSEMHKRGCNFDIVFFEELEQLCAPLSCTAENVYKYLLTREIVIRHLSRSMPEVSPGVKPQVLRFDSLEDERFEAYLSNHAVHFFLCHEGDGSSGVDDVALRHLISQILSKGRSVAIINHVDFMSSKMFAPLLSGTDRSILTTPLEIEYEERLDVATLKSVVRIESADVDAVVDQTDKIDLTVRDVLCTSICRAMRQAGGLEHLKDDSALFDEMIQALMLQASTTQQIPLSERQDYYSLTSEEDDKSEIGAKAKEFLHHVAEAAYLVLAQGDSEVETGPVLASLESKDLAWDLYDLVDGRLFFSVLQKLRKGQSFPKQVVERAKILISTTRSDVNDRNAEVKLNSTSETSTVASTPPSATTQPPKVLAFSHPIIDEYLGELKLDEAVEQDSSGMEKIVFKDLAHWHDSKKTTPANKLPAKKGFFANKRHQKYMADIEAYSESLTNAQGGVLTRETIVTAPKNTKSASSQQAQIKADILSKNDQKKAKGKGEGTKTKPQQSKGPPTGGKAIAHHAAKQVQDVKAEKHRADLRRHWTTTCALFEKDMSLISRYNKAENFALLRASKEDRKALGGEVELYLCHILGTIWHRKVTQSKSSKNAPPALYLISIIWNWIQSSFKHDYVSPTAVKTVQKITSLLKISSIPMTVGTQTQDFVFRFNQEPFEVAGQLVKDHTVLQLQHGGPYMDRRFDPQPDSRVKFEPDAWQREVLDSIDNDNSLLVIAPTSAGKTFISFYAMKKVLEESDDSVLVYVAPTKALVNQIAAEINAHYSKSYHGKAGKSLYAIHTRDYRVNNPTGCQILVTVPHILQIMLLSANNANGPNAWSKRVKRIIFDEVHCIGQSEDGVIWEQLLLLAPCPIVALSATVGNPQEFHDWLALSQAKKGFKMDMVVHNVRYSELRKFIYEGSDKSGFKGLEKKESIAAPGLDEGEDCEARVQFLHPVLALSNRNRSALGDISLEARDCFTLWTSMKELLSKDEMTELGVPDPYRTLPEVITKSDVIQWETKIKESLWKLIDTNLSAFNELHRRLQQQKGSKEIDAQQPEIAPKRHVETLLDLASDLHRSGGLPALVFNYDRIECEVGGQTLLAELIQAEDEWKDKSPEWTRKLNDFEEWKKSQLKKPTKPERAAPSKGKRDDSEKTSKLETMISEANNEHNRWESFDPTAPLEQFSFADHSKLQRSEFEELVVSLKWEDLPPWMTSGLLRGIGVHHSGLNRRYRQMVEILFRKGYLRLVIATGTLAMGINMPCKTVVFSGDSIFLTAQNYRQSSGRAGRRGFDLLGNVVFNGIPKQRVYEIMASRLPDLRGQFPVSTTLVLRLLDLLHGTKNSDFAVKAASSLLSQTRLFLGGPESEGAIKHHLRFSIEYLRRQRLLSAKGEPLNFAGLTGHLYFTENSVFAFHSLLKGGYFHRLCADIDSEPKQTLLDMMLVLSHIFNRVSAKRTDQLTEVARRSTSSVFLTRLPQEAEKLLVAHNRETLDIFKGYVHSYVSHNLNEKPDYTLPYTQKTVGGEPVQAQNNPEQSSAKIRSPFVALSGFSDDFKSVHELCSTVRDGVFLEEASVPYLPVWPVETDTELNAYIYDFYKHGNMEVLVKDNRIKGGDVWFHLKNFSLTLATIVASLEAAVNGDKTLTGDMAEDDVAENATEAKAVPSAPDADMANGVVAGGGAKKPKKKVVKDSWDDSESGGDDSDDDSALTPDGDEAADQADRGLHYDGGGLPSVLKAFTLLKEEFDTKFRKVWA